MLEICKKLTEIITETSKNIGNPKKTYAYRNGIADLIKKIDIYQSKKDPKKRLQTIKVP